MRLKRKVSARNYFDRPLWFSTVNTVWEKFYRFGSRPSLEKNELIETARRGTGLNDLGKDFWDEPLERLVYSLNNEARLHPIGYFISRNRIINLLAVRLRAEYWFKKHPGILEQELYPTTVIVGLQRTGTTKLHRLLKADPDNRVLKSWEAINPAPFKQLNGAKDKRIRVAKTSERALRMISPGFFTIHPVEYVAPEEDILLLDTTFLSTTPEATTHVPSYAAWLEETDQSLAYSYGSKLLKLLQWQVPGKRWVLKSPHHLEFMHLIEKHLGTPHFLWTHRDPNECIPSFLSMVSHSRTIFSNEVHLDEVVDHWIRKTTYMLEKGLQYRMKDRNQEYFTDILYTDLVKKPMEQLDLIYARNGGIPEELRQAFIRAEKENPQDKYGTHEYSYSDFGLEEDDLEKWNRDYYHFYKAMMSDNIVGS